MKYLYGIELRIMLVANFPNWSVVWLTSDLMDTGQWRMYQKKKIGVAQIILGDLTPIIPEHPSCMPKKKI